MSGFLLPFLVLVIMVRLSDSTTVTFSCISGSHTHQIPADVTTAQITVVGAQGGSDGSYTGGKGAKVVAQVPLVPNAFYSIDVGCQNGWQQYVFVSCIRRVCAGTTANYV